jgi:hypothetical protein
MRDTFGPDAPLFHFPSGPGGEDTFFCKMVIEAGLKVWCLPTVRIGHIDYDGNYWHDGVRGTNQYFHGSADETQKRIKVARKAGIERHGLGGFIMREPTIALPSVQFRNGNGFNPKALLERGGTGRR